MLLAVLSACNVFDKLEQCETDTVCPWGYQCKEGFCEPDEGPVVIGVSMPLSGALGATGAAIATVFPLVEFQVSGTDGIDGRPVRFDVVDDETSPTAAVDVFKRFAKDRVTAVVGPLTSPQAVEILDLTAKNQLVTVSSGAGADELSTGQPLIDRWFFRTMSSVERGSATALVRFAQSGPPGGAPCERLAVVHSDDAIGETYRDAMLAKFPEVGDVVDTIPIPPGEQLDYSDTIDALIASDPQCALLVASSDAGAALLAEFKPRQGELPSSATFFWLGSSTLATADFLKESARQGDIGEGLYGADIDSHPTTPEFNDFVRSYNAFYGEPEDALVPSYAANAYDAGVLLVLAAAGGGTTDPISLRDAVWEVTSIDEDHAVFGPSDIDDALSSLQRGDPIHFSGASSQLTLDGYGTVSLPSLVWQIQDGEVVVIRRYSEDGKLLE